MKTSGKFLLGAIALSLANLAFAGATFKDVETAVKVNHDYIQGENLMRDVVAANPDNARDHYVFAQILDHNGKHDEAEREFGQVKRLDPSYSFEKNPARVAAFGNKLSNEDMRAPTPRTGLAQAPASHYVAPVAVPPPPMPVPQKPGHALLWVVLILGVIGVAAFFFFRRTQEKDRIEDEERMKGVRQDQLKQANAMLESVKPLRLDMRMASPPETALLGELDDAEKQLIDLIERLAKAPVARDEIEQQAATLARLRRRLEGKSEPNPAPAPAPAADPGTQTVYQGGQYAGPVAQPLNMGGNTVYQPGYPQMVQQPVYVEQNSGLGGVGGLLAGIAVGSMLSGSHDREVIREIHEVREVPVPQYEERERNRGSRADDIDFGDDNGSAGDTGNSSDDGGGVDFGGSDDN
ncbi:MAG TPA: hypothetical protein VIF60_05855 [Burkholderiaceae bacterium]